MEPREPREPVSLRACHVLVGLCAPFSYISSSSSQHSPM